MDLGLGRICMAFVCERRKWEGFFISIKEMDEAAADIGILGRTTWIYMCSHGYVYYVLAQYLFVNHHKKQLDKKRPVAPN